MSEGGKYGTFLVLISTQLWPLAPFHILNQSAVAEKFGSEETRNDLSAENLISFLTFLKLDSVLLFL